MTTAPYWVTAFLDFAPGDVERGTNFWQGVTGYGRSGHRGADGEFATLVPPDGDDYLRVQGLGDGDGRIHLDLHVENPTYAAEGAIELGAHVVVRHEASRKPPPATWPDGTRSVVDQVCLDIPPSRYDAEVEFWRTLTGWDHDPDVSREFARLHPPDDQPLRWLLQRLDDDEQAVRAHLDLSCDDRAAETARHVALGATAGARHDDWTVLTDPVGTTYCITRRKP